MSNAFDAFFHKHFRSRKDFKGALISFLFFFFHKEEYGRDEDSLELNTARLCEISHDLTLMSGGRLRVSRNTASRERDSLTVRIFFARQIPSHDTLRSRRIIMRDVTRASPVGDYYSSFFIRFLPRTFLTADACASRSTQRNGTTVISQNDIAGRSCVRTTPRVKSSQYAKRYFPAVEFPSYTLSGLEFYSRLLTFTKIRAKLRGTRLLAHDSRIAHWLADENPRYLDNLSFRCAFMHEENFILKNTMYYIYIHPSPCTFRKQFSCYTGIKKIVTQTSKNNALLRYSKKKIHCST